MRKVVIIGAGIGGLSTACLLAKEGYEVTVLEKNAQPGGRAGQIKAKGFTFDTGPSWYLMPEVFEHYFELLGEDINKLLDLKKLQPNYQVVFKDTLLGSVEIHGDISKDSTTFNSFEPGAGRQLKQYLDTAEYKYRFAKNHILYKNFDSKLDFLTPKFIMNIRKLNIFQSLQSHVEGYFHSSELQKIMLYPSVFLGGSPTNIPALYSLLNWVDFKQGVYYPMGGLYSLVEKLVQIAEAHNVQIRYDSPVEKIIVEDGLAKGVVSKGNRYDADIVVNNADIEHTDSQLLDKPYRMYSKGYWRKRTIAPSALVIYLGVKGEYSGLKHHNLVFTKDWQKHFKAIFDKKRWFSDPSFYVSNVSKTDPKVAPKGHENLFVLAPIAPGLKYTDRELEQRADEIIETMEHTLHLSSLRKNIVYRRIFSVKDYEQQFNSYQGSALGLTHTLKQSAINRPRNVHRQIPNLYYVGAGTTPGIGIPMCLISAELVYKRIIGDNSDS
jgi:phytoene desaturase